MDAFFAAIEQLDHPEYRGKPVIVGADPQGGKGRGVVSTASYEARKYGIHSAMPISQAYRLCPHAIFLPVRGERYAAVSHQIMVILADFTPLVEQVSIDEAFLDISQSLNLFGSPEALGQAIKARIRAQTQLTGSVGIAPNKFVAKVASEFQKPDGLVVVRDGEVQEFLRPLPINKLWGVGPKTERSLRERGYSTIGQIADTPKERLIQQLGQWGLHLWELANGIDDRPVSPTSIAKSVSQETTFSVDTDDVQQMENTLRRLADDLGALMRKEGLKGRTITLKIRLEDFSTFTRSRTVPDFTDSSDFFYRMARDLFRRFDRQGKKVRLLGIGVSHLNTVGGEQLTLFKETPSMARRLERVLDEVQTKFGGGALRRASTLTDE